MNIKKFFLLAVLLPAMFLSISPVGAVEIRLSVAASMTNSFREIIREFVREHPGTTVFPNFASSGSLARQIAQGAPADLYASANTQWMAYLVGRKMIVPATVQILARNSLVFIGPKKTGINGMKDILTLSRIALGSPKSVPAGQYAAQAMQATGVYKPLADAHRLVMAKDVRQALLYADRGEVDGAFVYRTDALLAKKAVILFLVPEDLHDPVSYTMGLTPEGAENSAARALFNYLRGPAAGRILSRYGFKPADRM